MADILAQSCLGDKRQDLVEQRKGMEQDEWAWPTREAGNRNSEEMGVAEAKRNPL